MSTVIDCPSCRRKLRVPREFIGKSVRCPTCNETFDAAEPAAPAPESAGSEPSPLLTVPIKLELDEPPPAPPRAAEPPPPPKEAPAPPRREPEPQRREERDERPRPRRRLRRDFEPCPRCDEDVRRGAVVCPYCGLDLEEQGDGYTRRPPVRRDAEPHRGGTIQALGIASLVMGVFQFLFFIGLPLGIAAWVMAGRDLRRMDEGTMDPNGRKKTRDGRLCGIVGTVLNSVFGLVILLIVFAIVMAANEAAPARPNPPPWNNNRPAFKNNPPPAWQNAPVANNFTLRGPQAITLRRGETKFVTINVDRAVGWHGAVVVEPPGAGDLDGVDVNPAEVKVPGRQTSAGFSVTAVRDADFGVQKMTFKATSDDGDDVTLDVSVNVTR